MEEKTEFWSGVTKENGKRITIKEQLDFCRDFIDSLKKSPELAKIFFNTQVYNEITNGVTTRGAHSQGVAIVAENLARQKAKFDGKSKNMTEVSALLSSALGYMHDLGHTPYGHDGEGALGNEMERFPATKEYKEKRIALYGEEYVEGISDENAEVMCYEHNETSSTIGSKLIKEFASKKGYNISDESLQYIKTGILAHSTSRVKTEPKGIEQKAVRLADKVAYIPQDFLDLLKQKVISVDDLSQDELTLLGLNENVLMDSEKAMIEEAETVEEETFLEGKIRDIKANSVKKLRKLDKMSPKTRAKFFQGLDSRVESMQAEIATKCFVERDGVFELDGQKNDIDYFEKFVNKNKVIDDRKQNAKVGKGIDLFRNFRYAQQHKVCVGEKRDENGKLGPDLRDIPEEDQKAAIDKAAQDYTKFLKKEYKMDPMMATLWVTKAKYQDAFIVGELLKTSVNKDGKNVEENLDEMNDKVGVGWEMKSTFQYFYSNIDQIPEDFTSNYRGKDQDVYTDQQLVSAFIASFTNNGLDDLYSQLKNRKLVISRDEAISKVKEARPDLDVDNILKQDKKWVDPQNQDAKYKVLANDVLEYLYEENVGEPIVAGKNQNKDRIIPKIPHEIAVRDGIEKKSDKSISKKEKPQLLSSLVDLSRESVSSKDIQEMVKTVREKQNEKEIQTHIDQVENGER